MGAVCFCVLMSLGEMSAAFPSKRGFPGFATRTIDPAFGFATALVYLCKYLILSPNQIVAGALVIRFWNDKINSAAWVTILIAFVVAMNFLGIKWFGEVEFWLSFIKILTLSGLIILGLVIDLGGGPNHDRIGFRYWKDGKAFVSYPKNAGPGGAAGRFLGVVKALVGALFAYMGTELIGVTVGEAKNPRKTVPAAIKKTFYRILFFYIILILLTGMVVDGQGQLLKTATSGNNKTTASASPFVVAIQEAGIKGLPGLVNACLLIFTFSAANSDQYIASRTLYGMAKDGNAPRIFTYCNSRGVPMVSFAFTGMFMLLAYICSSADGLSVWSYFTSAVTICGALSWISILSSHLAMMRGLKAQGISRDTLPYKSPFQPYAAIFALFITVLIAIFKGFDAFIGPTFKYKDFICHYIAVPVYVFGFLIYKFVRKTKFVKPHEMDLHTGAREFQGLDEDDEDEMRYKSMSFKDKVIYQLKNW